MRRLPYTPEWRPGKEWTAAGIKGGRAWQSNGGASRRHPARALPFSLEVSIPEGHGRLKQVLLFGVFAALADPSVEASGGLGAALTLSRSKKVVHRVDLIQGRHYSDAADTAAIYRPNGDGTCLETVGTVVVDDAVLRLDVLSVAIPPQAPPETLLLTDLGTPASFVIFEVVFDFDQATVCPFRGHGGQVGLHELSAILRLRDWPRYERALAQLQTGIREESRDLDEARGLALTFLASVTTSLLEAGSDKRMHQFLLHAARSLEAMDRAEDIAEHAVALSGQLAQELFGDQHAPAESLIHRALAFINLHYAEPLTDAQMAKVVRLSTSHFRHLFKVVTKQSFHKYLLSLRLEKAREALLQTDVPVAEVAERTGFASPAHFSRAFSHRFGASPSAIRGQKV